MTVEKYTEGYQFSVNDDACDGATSIREALLLLAAEEPEASEFSIDDLHQRLATSGYNSIGNVHRRLSAERYVG